MSLSETIAYTEKELQMWNNSQIKDTEVIEYLKNVLKYLQELEAMDILG